MLLPRAATVALAGAALAAAAWTALAPDDAAFSLLLVALALTATAYAWLESGPGSAAELALIGALAGIAAAGRVLFAAVPGVQPVTVIAVAAGAALGARAGMAVGATAALVSNLFLGQGPWTPWQMLGWAGCGLAGALARRAIQGAFRSRCSAPRSASRSARSWTSGCGSASTRTRGRRSRPCSHVACRSTSRTRSATSSSPSSRGRSCDGCSNAMAAACGRRSYGTEGARRSRAAGARWRSPRLAQFCSRRSRQPDGGFAEAEGVASPALTAWAALGLVAAGQAPAGTLDYLRAHEGDALPPATRALVALAAAALGDPQLAGRLSTTAGQTNAIVWTILARRQAGLAAPKPLVSALLARQAKSGGWGWAKGVAPDSNDTAAAVQALRAAGVTGRRSGARSTTCARRVTRTAASPS